MGCGRRWQGAWVPSPVYVPNHLPLQNLIFCYGVKETSSADAGKRCGGAALYQMADRRCVCTLSSAAGTAQRARAARQTHANACMVVIQQAVRNWCRGLSRSGMQAVPLYSSQTAVHGKGATWTSTSTHIAPFGHLKREHPWWKHFPLAQQNPYAKALAACVPDCCLVHFPWRPPRSNIMSLSRSQAHEQPEA